MENSVQHQFLIASIRELIEDSKPLVALAVNATMSMLYWRIGIRMMQFARVFTEQKIVVSATRQSFASYIETPPNVS